MAKVEFELNLKLTKLLLRAHPSTPPEVIEQCETTVKDSIAVIDTTVKDYIVLF